MTASSTIVLQRDRLAPPDRVIGRDHDLGPGVVHPRVSGLSAEPAEDDRVDGADPGAGEHRDHLLGHDRHVDADPVALLDAE